MRFIIIERVAPKPKKDFTVTNAGSLVLLTPNTNAAQQWIDEHIPSDAQTFGLSIVVEPRYIQDILYGIESDGLTIEVEQ
jgi:hypothetical protein